MCVVIGHDGRLVHEASRVSFQMRERIYDRDGILGWSRIEKSSISRTKSKSDDKRNLAEI